MGGGRKTIRTVALVISLVMLFASLPAISVWAEGDGKGVLDPNDYDLLAGTDFEDSSTWRFSASSGASVSVTGSEGSKYLEASGSGNGMRTIAKTLDSPTSKAKVLIAFDWRPGTVSSSANSSEVLFTDEGGNPIFRIVKKGGTDGAIGYSVGTTGWELSGVSYVEGLNTDGKWLSTKILFDFVSETVSFEIADKEDNTKYARVLELSLKNLYYINRIKEIIIRGNRAPGEGLSFTTNLDNIYIYVSKEDAPEPPAKNITEIVSEYVKEYKFGTGVSMEEILSFFPSSLSIKLENGVIIDNRPVSWSYDGSGYFDPNSPGTYNFTGTIALDGIVGIKNENNVRAEIEVTVLDVAIEPPEIEGYKVAYYTDFGDKVMVIPQYWGFTTSNATLSMNMEDISGNSTPKLQLSITKQGGSRTANKKFESPVRGDTILVKFEWYPGLLNNKGNNPYENSGEIKLYNSSGNLILTINNTRNEPLKYIIGDNKEIVQTGFTNPETWFDVEIKLDVLSNKSVTLKLIDKQTQVTEVYTSSLEGVPFDGTIDTVALKGVRTSGNNITWTTYIDNFGIYCAISD